jgi:predicted nucleic acid-binding protein
MDRKAERQVIAAMYFVDTNLFIRFLTLDDPEKAGRCKILFEKARAGDIKLYTSEMVIAELVWVLQSPGTYNQKPERIRELLLPLLTMKNLNFPNKKLYPAILELFASTTIDYIDAYNAILMQQKGITDIYSYDSHFDLIDKIKRLVP